MPSPTSARRSVSIDNPLLVNPRDLPAVESIGDVDARAAIYFALKCDPFHRECQDEGDGKSLKTIANDPKLIAEVLPWLKSFVAFAANENHRYYSQVALAKVEPDWLYQYTEAYIGGKFGPIDHERLDSLLGAVNDPRTAKFAPYFAANVDAPDREVRFYANSGLKNISPGTSSQVVLEGLIDIARSLEMAGTTGLERPPSQRLRVLWQESIAVFESGQLPRDFVLLMADELKKRFVHGSGEVRIEGIAKGNINDLGTIESNEVKFCLERCLSVLRLKRSLDSMDSDDSKPFYDGLRELRCRGPEARAATPWLVRWSQSRAESLSLSAQRTLAVVNPDVALELERVELRKPNNGGWVDETKIPLLGARMVELIPDMIGAAARYCESKGPLVLSMGVKNLTPGAGHIESLLEAISAATIRYGASGATDIPDVSRQVWKKSLEILEKVRNVEEPSTREPFVAGLNAIVETLKQ